MVIAGDEAATHHLLRHLHNWRALRENSLVSRFFQSAGSSDGHVIAQHIRTRVLQAIGSLKSPGTANVDIHALRQHAILTRYDVGHESRQQVASDLGIRESKFYYERRAALGRLSEVLRGWLKAESRKVDVCEDRFSVEKRCAIALMERGQFDLAIELLRNLAREMPGSRRRVAVLCHLASALCGTGRLREAAETLDLARRSMASSEGTQCESALLNAQIDHSAVELAWTNGESREALEIAGRARRSLLSICDSGHEPRFLLASLLNSLGAIQTNAGMLADALTNYSEALKTLDACDPVPAPFRASVLSNLAFAQAIMPGGMRLARKTNAAALQAAQQEGLLRGVALAHLNELQFQHWAGKPQIALTHGRLAQAISDGTCEPVERARVAVLLARVEALCGYELDGLQRIHKARQLLSGKNYIWVLSQVVESQILTRLQSHKSALHSARLAWRRADSIGSVRGSGMAALALAQAYELQADAKQATHALDLSIPALEESAALFPLAQALACSARLTGNQRHQYRAVELLSSFNQLEK